MITRPHSLSKLSATELNNLLVQLGQPKSYGTSKQALIIKVEQAFDAQPFICGKCHKDVDSGACDCEDEEYCRITKVIAARIEADLKLDIGYYEDDAFTTTYRCVFNKQEVPLSQCGVLASVLRECHVTVNVGLKDNVIYLKYDFSYAFKSGGTNGADVLIKLDATTGAEV